MVCNQMILSRRTTLAPPLGHSCHPALYSPRHALAIPKRRGNGATTRLELRHKPGRYRPGDRILLHAARGAGAWWQQTWQQFGDKQTALAGLMLTLIGELVMASSPAWIPQVAGRLAGRTINCQPRTTSSIWTHLSQNIASFQEARAREEG